MCDAASGFDFSPPHAPMPQTDAIHPQRFGDDDVVHPLWFIVRRGAGATVPILVPRRNIVERVTVEAAGSERLSIDLRLYETTRYRLKGPGGERLVWLAADGRIIKATLPGLHLTAIRD